MYSVKDIRDGVCQVDEKPGLYKWWCTCRVLKDIAEKLQCDITKCSIEKNNECDLFCVYVGVAVKETLKERIEWHMGNHTDGSVRNKTLSTLKQSLSAILYQNMSPKLAKELDDYMNQFYVSVDTKFSEAQDIYAEEKRLLSPGEQPLYILNIQLNQHKQSPKKELKKRRKEAWNEAMKQINQI